jgi:predicted acetyltransferase
MENMEQMRVKLVKPSMEYKESFLEAEREYTEEGKPRHSGPSMVRQELEENFGKFIEKTVNQEKGIDLPAGYVPASSLWLIDNNKFIGTASIRHTLNENLLKIGGHIGYSIRPSKRKMGYGTKILELALPEARKLGIKKVLVTCDDDNIASAKIIEKNGGVLENKIEGEYDGEIKKLKRRYWIVNK